MQNKLVDYDVIKYLITKFENQLRENPLSPEFVKLSNYYLINGNVNEAVDLLKAGLKIYPDYVTAKLLLGKCFLANKYYFDAKKVFEQILDEYPGMNIAKKFLDISVELTKNEVSRKHAEDVIPKLEFRAPEFNDFDYNYNLFPSYEIEDLADDRVNTDDFESSNEFIDFQKILESPYFFKKDNTKPSLQKKRLRNKFEVNIITETLADIFAKQGNYFDAIEAYTHLLKIKPDRKDEIENKINEVEIQIQKLINDF